MDTGLIYSMGEIMSMKPSAVEEILEEQFKERVYAVEDGIVWISGMNAACGSVARKMARYLTHTHDIPTSLVYDDDATKFGGVQFNWGESA